MDVALDLRTDGSADLFAGPEALVSDAPPRPGSLAGGRAASLGGSSSPGGGFVHHGTGLPSGDPLSTRTQAGESPWGRVVGWGGGPYPAEVLPDSDLSRSAAPPGTRAQKSRAAPMASGLHPAPVRPTPSSRPQSDAGSGR